MEGQNQSALASQPQDANQMPSKKGGLSKPLIIFIALIVIVAFVFLILPIITALLFSVGTFNSPNPFSNTCVASNEYVCLTPILHNGNFTVTIGQATGNWNSATVYFDSGNTTGCTNQPAGAYASYAVPGGLPVGESKSITFSGGPLPKTVGMTIYGTIWVNYTYIYSSIPTTIQGHVGGEVSQCVEMATVVLKAT